MSAGQDLALALLAAVAREGEGVPSTPIVGRRGHCSRCAKADEVTLRRCSATRLTVLRCQEALLTDSPMLVNFAQQTLRELAAAHGVRVS